MRFRLVVLVLFGSSVWMTADDTVQQVITLKDKSVIRAHVTEVTDGFYLAKSPVLGDMKIPTGEVLSIRDTTAATPDSGIPGTPAEPGNGMVLLPATPVGSPAPANLDSLRSSVASQVQNFVTSREGMNAVMEYSKNQDFKALMNDPQVMQAVLKGDYETLMKSPAIKKLLDNPQTQALVQSITQSKSQNSAPTNATLQGASGR